MRIVYFYMKGQAKQFQKFNTFEEAVAFLKALKTNPDCEACGFVRF